MSREQPNSRHVPQSDSSSEGSGSEFWRERATESLGYDPYDEARTPVNGGPEAVVRNAVERIDRQLDASERGRQSFDQQAAEERRRRRGE